MKRVKSKGIFAALAAVLLALVLWAGSYTPPLSVSAAGEYDYTIERYTVDFDLKSDRTAQVKEEIEVSFTGWGSHGIIRDFTLGGGVRYHNLKATCDNPDFYPYIQTDDSDFLSYYLRGDGLVTGQTRTYTITYTMLMPALKEEGYLPINLIGYGWTCKIHNVTVRVTLPDGLKDFKVYSGEKGYVGNKYASEGSLEGNVLTVTASELPRSGPYSFEQDTAAGITLDLSFENGVLTTAKDNTPLLSALLGIALFAIAALVKVFGCKQPIFSKTVNFEAPEGMDPLLMGKLVDNTVDSEDMGALVFWFADQGYLTIDMTEDKDDPILLKTQKELPDRMPPHCKDFYKGLFSDGDSTKVSSLKNSFYMTADKVRTKVNVAVGKNYQTKSYALMGVFLVLSVLLLGGFSFFYNLIKVAPGYHVFFNFVTCALAFVFGALASFFVAQHVFKWKKLKCVLFTLIGVGIWLLIALFSLIFPCAAHGKFTNFLCTVFAGLTGTLSGFFLVRTPDYSEKLGQILGFKQFIEFTERDKVEFMLQENPELYYHVLPYAQVLGVTNAWSEKFEGLNMSAPSYVRTGNNYTYVDYLVYRSMFRSLNHSLARNMVSRPSSSGGGGKFGGGFGGGFSGGGFGGGGGRGC